MTYIAIGKLKDISMKDGTGAGYRTTMFTGIEIFDDINEAIKLHREKKDGLEWRIFELGREVNQERCELGHGSPSEPLGQT